MFGLSLNRIASDSMSPAINNHSYVLMHSYFLRKHLQVGDIVQVEHLFYGALIKRIKFIDRNGFYWLQGENEKGLTTLEIGPIRARQIKYKFFASYEPAHTLADAHHH